MDTFGQRLKELRTSNGLTRSNFAEIIHKSPTSVAGYELYVITPDIETIMFIADYFHVSLDYLFGRTDIKGSLDDEIAEKQATLKKLKDTIEKVLEVHKKVTQVGLELIECLEEMDGGDKDG